ncbi:hypothetical protein Dpo_4c03250 [Desulfotignum phosphitoxidans DSM 13687]|jgi:hypothetical protein|uniref:Uncharacterized protein n=1 Tax=Desulfotignum phosphitoxidans DSM 13687 TaxID=1286635 RepID=S0FXK5_9BACT|nr:hypothetical protein Dpo_4c03250 [Desulfotignum phosphitoxidans DSM 13687]
MAALLGNRKNGKMRVFHYFKTGSFQTTDPGSV